MVLWLISFYYTFQLSFPSEYMLLYFIQTNVIMDKANKRKKLNTAYQNFAKKYELLVKKQNNEKVHVSPKAKQNLYWKDHGASGCHQVFYRLDFYEGFENTLKILIILFNF